MEKCVFDLDPRTGVSIGDQHLKKSKISSHGRHIFNVHENIHEHMPVLLGNVPYMDDIMVVINSNIYI